MPNTPPRKPQTPCKPKLRSSCDRCGAAKLKCDRGLPLCGRCIHLGLACVYGVSQKKGKPPREGRPLSEVTGISRRPDESSGNISRDRPDDDCCSSDVTGSLTDSTVLSSGPLPSLNNVPLAWGASYSYYNSLTTSADASDVTQNDLFRSSASDFTSLEFNDDMLDTFFQNLPVSTLGTPKFEGHSTSTAETRTTQTQIDENVAFDSTSMPSTGSRGHDCSREAYDILGSLSLLNPTTAHCVSGISSSSASTIDSATHRVPFDQILRLNREAIERLRCLLTCHCARKPHQALLYASIISLILTWYEEASSCTQEVSWSPVAAATDTVSCNEFPSGSQSSWSTTALCTVTTGGPSTPTYTGATAVAPTHMAIGSFTIDDQQVQAALRIQLLLGESRRTGSLIDLYRSSSGVDESTFGSVDSLYKNLSSWLKQENSRIADVMRSTLKEVGT